MRLVTPARQQLFYVPLLPGQQLLSVPPLLPGSQDGTVPSEEQLDFVGSADYVSPEVLRDEVGAAFLPRCVAASQHLCVHQLRRVCACLHMGLVAVRHMVFHVGANAALCLHIVSSCSLHPPRPISGPWAA